MGFERYSKDLPKDDSPLLVTRVANHGDLWERCQRAACRRYIPTSKPVGTKYCSKKCATRRTKVSHAV